MPPWEPAQDGWSPTRQASGAVARVRRSRGFEDDELPEHATSNPALPEAISTRTITDFLTRVIPRRMNRMLQNPRYLTSTSV
jgi:hypothetical protein